MDVQKRKEQLFREIVAEIKQLEDSEKKGGTINERSSAHSHRAGHR